MRVLITGGAGFIGSTFTRYLLKNHPSCEVVVVDALTYAGNLDNLYTGPTTNERLTFWYGDVTNSDLMNELLKGMDYVVHFAAESHVARSISHNKIFFSTDVLGTQTIANAVLKNRQTLRGFIHISSSEVYGTALESPMSEEHPLMPSTPYAAAKAGADRLVYSYAVTYGMPAVIVRPFNVYGPHQHLEKVVPRFITSILLGEPLTVHGVGDSSRDWLYVEDLCNALDRLLGADFDSLKGQVINIGTGKETTIMELAQTILEKMGNKDYPIKHLLERPGQVQKHICDWRKASKVLGWKPQVPLQQGFDETIAWYQSHRDWWMSRLCMKHVAVKDAEGKTCLY